jgi:hypothetical protein
MLWTRQPKINKEVKVNIALLIDAIFGKESEEEKISYAAKRLVIRYMLTYTLILLSITGTSLWFIAKNVYQASKDDAYDKAMDELQQRRLEYTIDVNEAKANINAIRDSLQDTYERTHRIEAKAAEALQDAIDTTDKIKSILTSGDQTNVKSYADLQRSLEQSINDDVKNSIIDTVSKTVSENQVLSIHVKSGHGNFGVPPDISIKTSLINPVQGRKLQFEKSPNANYVRITYTDNFRTLNRKTHGMCRWRILVNNVDCKDPAPMEFTRYEDIAYENSHNSNTVVGFCSLDEKDTKVSVAVQVERDTTDTECFTGYDSSLYTLEVEELSSSLVMFH